MWWTRLLAQALLVVALPCAASPVTLPPFSPAYEPLTVDERGMWMSADERERLLRDSALRIREGGLEAYVRDVLCRTVGEERCHNVRVYVLEIPAFNATMLPNGCLEVWSGLLLRVRNEAELAAVLGHEFGHFELRHGLAAFKAQRSMGDVLAWTVVVSALTKRDQVLPAFLAIRSFYRFTRSQETEADLMGLKYLVTAGYPPSAAAAVWRQLMGEEDATAIGRGLKPRHAYHAGLFDTHPTEARRVDDLGKAAAMMAPDGDAQAARYKAAVAPYLMRFLAAQIKMNDFGGSDFLLGSLASEGGWTGELLFERAELYRLRGNPRDLQLASGWYREAKSAGYANPELDRSLGLTLLRNGQADEARRSLNAYLQAQPSAPDAKMIRALVAQ